MIKAYKVFAYLIAIEVVIQAAAIAYAIMDFHSFIVNGATVTPDNIETIDFSGGWGFFIHGINGQFLIPLFAIILFILSFFAKRIKHGIAYASTILGLIVVQVFLGLASSDLPLLGLLHGANALAIFTFAILAIVAARKAQKVPEITTA